MLNRHAAELIFGLECTADSTDPGMLPFPPPCCPVLSHLYAMLIGTSVPSWEVAHCRSLT